MTIRVGLYSEDGTLQPLLASALGKEFLVLMESDEDGLDALIASGECDVLILDLYCNHDSLVGRTICARRLIKSNIPSVILADDNLRSTALELVRLGAYGQCNRPPLISDLKDLVREAYENRPRDEESPEQTNAQAEQAVRVRNSCDRLIGASPRMQHVYEMVHRVANLNASVLVTGESGTGKELIARAIRNLGTRASRPFVAVSCGAIPETLIEAELFGHEKGAFTGTVGSREGYFEQAGDGTLFLDEIGDLSPYTQVKLLRVLQQMEFSRLGSNKLIPLRARLIFATHQDLQALVAEGKFRQDLFYRINVMKIESPPLREHPEDIEQIAMHFLSVYSKAYSKPMLGIDTMALALLTEYPWPGNVRELENTIQSAIIMAQEKTLRADDLPMHIQEENVVNIEDYQPSGSFERQLRDYKIKLAVTAVRENNGNKTLAARSLCISRAYLHRLLRLAGSDSLIETDNDRGSDNLVTGTSTT